MILGAEPGSIPGKVAVIGAGTIGGGWAALCASAGWPVTIFDTNARAVEDAMEDIPRRARALIELGRATSGIVERGLLEFKQAKSLLQAVRDADWVIEAIHEDLGAKQRLLESIEQVAAPRAIVTSSSSGLAPGDLFGRLLQRGRCLVAHPLNPPELLPLVEVVPGAETEPWAIETASAYLLALGRMPIVLRRAVPGYVVGRISAAVWRECIDLVLNGAIDVADLDRAVSQGPAEFTSSSSTCSPASSGGGRTSRRGRSWTLHNSGPSSRRSNAPTKGRSSSCGEPGTGD